MELRGYREGDGASLARLAAGAFGASAGYWDRYFQPGGNARVDLDLVRLVQEDGDVRASATILPLEAFVDGRPVPMGGIGAVVTDPAYRRRGYAGKLMRDVLREMRERGVHLSVLWPFAHAFYRTYGWELAGEALAYTLKPTDLPSSPEQRRIRAYRDEDLPRMMELFERECGPAFVLRAPERRAVARGSGARGMAGRRPRAGRTSGGIHRLRDVRVEGREAATHAHGPGARER